MRRTDHAPAAVPGALLVLAHLTTQAPTRWVTDEEREAQRGGARTGNQPPGSRSLR